MRCDDIGHDYYLLKGDRHEGKERCKECGHEQYFYYNDTKTYAREHRRDFLQPSDKKFLDAYEKIAKTEKTEKPKNYTKEDISKETRSVWKWFKRNRYKFSSNQLKSGEWIKSLPKTL